MRSSRFSRGVPLPNFWQFCVIGVASGLGWLLWQEFENPVESLNSVEKFAKGGRAAVPRLAAELSAADPGARAIAVHGLGTIGPAAADALDLICERLIDDSPMVRASAIIALRSVSQDNDECGRVIAGMLADSNADVRETAATQLLFRIGPAATKDVLNVLQNELAAARSRALRLLRNWKQPESTGWTEWIADVHGPVRDLLHDSDSGLRIDALTALVAWGIAEPDEVRKLLLDEDVGRVEIALGAFPEMGERAAVLLPDVIVLIDRYELDGIPPHGFSMDPRLLRLILNALKTLERGGRSAAPRLIRLLEARHDSTRTPIIETLGAIGAESEDLVRVLSRLLLDEDRNTAFQAGRLLADVSPEAARGEVSTLFPKLGSGKKVNISVLWALHALGRQAREAAPTVVPLVDNPNILVSWIAQQVLNDIGPPAAPLTPAAQQKSSVEGERRATSARDEEPCR